MHQLICSLNILPPPGHTTGLPPGVRHCVVPENIHTSPMEGLGNSEGEGGLIVENFWRKGGLGEHHNFPQGFLSKK